MARNDGGPALFSLADIQNGGEGWGEVGPSIFHVPHIPEAGEGGVVNSAAASGAVEILTGGSGGFPTG